MPLSVITQLENIVHNRQAAAVRFLTGGSLPVDLFSASTLLQVYAALNSTNQEKAERLVSSKDGLLKFLDLAFRQSRRSYRSVSDVKLREMEIFTRNALDNLQAQIGFLENYKQDGSLDRQTLEDAYRPVSALLFYANGRLRLEKTYRTAAALIRKCLQLSSQAERDDDGRPSPEVARLVLQHLRNAVRLLTAVNLSKELG